MHALKTIYFVRHGATALLEKRAYQFPDTPLSELGRRQAHFVGKRFASIPIDIIISSHMTRAQETAAEIAKTTDASIVVSDLFHEVMRPSALWGKEYTDPSIRKDMEFIHANFANPHLKHSDEENFFDLRSRGIQALSFLMRRNEARIGVTTHGLFLKMLVALMMHGDKVEYWVFKNFLDALEPKNTGITTFHFDHGGNGRWTMVTWDDHAHLGEIT